MKRKLVSIILTLAMVLAMLPAVAPAARADDVVTTGGESTCGCENGNMCACDSECSCGADCPGKPKSECDCGEACVCEDNCACTDCPKDGTKCACGSKKQDDPSKETPSDPERPGFSGGDGTKEHPYQITTKADLWALSDYSNSGADLTGVYFKQTRDIDLGGVVYRNEKGEATSVENT